MLYICFAHVGVKGLFLFCWQFSYVITVACKFGLYSRWPMFENVSKMILQFFGDICLFVFYYQRLCRAMLKWLLHAYDSCLHTCGVTVKFYRFCCSSVNPLTPTVAIRVQLHSILCQTGLSRNCNFWHLGTLMLRGERQECQDVKKYMWRLNPVWHRMLYSCTRMPTVGVNGLMM